MAHPKKIQRYKACILQDMPQYWIDMLDVIDIEEYWIWSRNVSQQRGIYIGVDDSRPSWRPILMEWQYQFVGT